MPALFALSGCDSGRSRRRAAVQDAKAGRRRREGSSLSRAVAKLLSFAIEDRPQITSRFWYCKILSQKGNILRSLPEPVLHRDVPKLAADYDFVVIDGPPRNYEVTRSAIAAADLVVIPVQPSGADFWASRETVKLADPQLGK